MAPVSGKWCRVWIDEFDLSGETHAMTTALNTDSEDVTPFQATGREYALMTTEMTISHDGYMTMHATDSMDAILDDGFDPSGTIHVGAAYGTNTPGFPVYVMPSAQTSEMTIDAPVAGVITINGGWTPGAAWQRTLAAHYGAISATGAQTYIDTGSVGSAGGNAYIWIQSITGSATNATITVESDSDSGFGTAATEATFTFSAVGSQAQTMSGTVNRYIRINVTSLGGATGFTVGVAVAVAGVTTPA